VGKTTTAVNLGACLAELGLRVLVVDLDPQGNATTGLGIDHSRRTTTAYDVLASGAQVTDGMIQTAIPDLWVLPSAVDLAGLDVELLGAASRDSILARSLEKVRREFDVVLIDCPPSIGLLTVNALAAADELIVPIQCEYFALEGLGQMLRSVRLIQERVNPDLKVGGILLTMFDGRTKLAEQVVSEVRAHFPTQVYEAIIPRSVRIAEAPGFGAPVVAFDSGSSGAGAYRELAREVAARLVAAAPVLAREWEEAPEVAEPAREGDPVVVLPELARVAVRGRRWWPFGRRKEGAR
jgi:chromosome partitioning protein